MGEMLHWYYAKDTRSHGALNKVQNFHVQNGIVNRATGIVKQIQYTENELGERCVQSCIVYIPDMTGPTFPNLPPKHAAILAKIVDIKFIHPDPVENA
jgi:hypothetical protein